MSEKIHIVAQHVLGKTSLEECSVSEIENVVKAFPYFAPAQFLLLQKLKAEHSSDYSKQLQKAVLFYHNPLVFEHFINSERFIADVVFEDDEEVEFESEVVPVAIDAGTEMFDNDPVENTSSLEVESQVESGITPLDTLVPKEKDADSELTFEKEEDDASKESLSLKTFVNPLHTPVEEKDLTFEPYHTVDYFASQGIKPTLEDPKDNFSKQLRSFTDWLKTMKKLPTADITKSVEAEKQIESMANVSVHEPEVITEAMADVWMKQGNKEKAIEIYNKLSLLNPSKRAFFAAKIENLKGSL